MSTRKMIAIAFAVLWTAYMAYAFFNQTGLYAAAVSWQSSAFGSYDPIWTIMLMWLVPTIVAVYFISPDAFKAAAAANYGAPEAGEATGFDGAHDSPQAAEIERLGKNIKATGWAWILGALASAAAIFGGLSMPSGHEAPTIMDLATLGDAAPPRGRVQIEGVVVTDAMMGLEEDTDGSIKIIAYAPIIAPGTENEAGGNLAPFQYFQKVETRGSEPSPGLFHRVGYLKAEALPVLVREGYEEYGIAVAKKTYVLDSAAMSWRETMFMIGSIIGLIAVITFALWIGFFVRRGRLNKQLRAMDPLG